MEFHENALQFFKDWVQNLTPVWLNCATATNFCWFFDNFPAVLCWPYRKQWITTLLNIENKKRKGRREEPLNI